MVTIAAKTRSFYLAALHTLPSLSFIYRGDQLRNEKLASPPLTSSLPGACIGLEERKPFGSLSIGLNLNEYRGAFASAIQPLVNRENFKITNDKYNPGIQFPILQCMKIENDKLFSGPFAEIRSTLDYSFHRHYSEDRQLLQDKIIRNMLRSDQIPDARGFSRSQPGEPLIIFTAGAMGVGKGYAINNLVERGLFSCENFVSVDPDEIRQLLPEYQTYLRENPLTAGELTQKEAGLIAEILILAALSQHKNILVDGSLRDSDWYAKYFVKLRKNYPKIKIGILHVTAPRGIIIKRAKTRGEKTGGRQIPLDIMEMAFEQVPKSVQQLSPLADHFCEVFNRQETKNVRVVTSWTTIESFQRNWLQSCSLVPSIFSGRSRRLLKSHKIC